MSAAPSFLACYRPTPAAHLTGLEASVHNLLHDFRVSFFGTRGVSSEVIAAVLRKRVACVSVAEVEAALSGLEAAGFAKQIAPNRYVEVPRGK